MDVLAEEFTIKQNDPNYLLLLVAVRNRADICFLEIIYSKKKEKKVLAFCTTTEVKEMQLILSFLINYVLSADLLHVVSG